MEFEKHVKMASFRSVGHICPEVNGELKLQVNRSNYQEVMNDVVKVYNRFACFFTEKLLT